MLIHQLVGKKAIRTGPVNYGNGKEDYSYSSEGLLVLAVTDSHIVYEHCDSFLKGRRGILDSRWVDDNWTDYDYLMGLADATVKRLTIAKIRSNS